MLKIDQKTKKIELTRGDTMILNIDLRDADNQPYIPGITDVIRFAMKKNYTDAEVLVNVEADIDDNEIVLTVPASATKNLEFGAYKYDIQLTTSDGVVNTFVNKGTILITEEVD